MTNTKWHKALQSAEIDGRVTNRLKAKRGTSGYNRGLKPKLGRIKLLGTKIKNT